MNHLPSIPSPVVSPAASHSSMCGSSVLRAGFTSKPPAPGTLTDGDLDRCCPGGVECHYWRAWRIEVAVQPLVEAYAVEILVALTHQKMFFIEPFETWMWCHTGETGLREKLIQVRGKFGEVYEIADQEFNGMEDKIIDLLKVHPRILQERHLYQAQLRSPSDLSGACPDSDPLDPPQNTTRADTLFSRPLSTTDGGSEVSTNIGVPNRHDIPYRPEQSRVASAVHLDAFQGQDPAGKIRTRVLSWRIEVGARITEDCDSFELEVELTHWANHFMRFTARLKVDGTNNIYESLLRKSKYMRVIVPEDLALQSLAIQTAAARHPVVARRRAQFETGPCAG